MSFANASFSRRKSGVKLPLGSEVRKDSRGFDDIAEFWKATEETETKSRRRSSLGSSRKERRSSSGGRSSTGESEVFDYDTSSEISEDDEEDNLTDDEVDISLRDQSPGKRGRRSSSSKRSSKASSLGGTVMDDAGAIPMDDDDGGFMDNQDDGGFGMDMDIDMGGDSPFAANESPLRASSGSSGKPGSAGGSGGKSRRVSFGAGTKDGSSSVTPKSRSGRRSGVTEIATPEPGDATTPETTPGSVALSTPGSNDFPRGQRVTDESYYDDDDDEIDLDDSFEMGGDDRDHSLVASARKKGLSYDDDDDDEEDDMAGRRSRRATKGKRFAYWKNERPVYDKGQIVGVLTAEPTPKKKKRAGMPLKKVGAGSKMHAPEEMLRPVTLPKDVEWMDSETLSVWDDTNDAIKSERVVCVSDALPEPAQLPITAKRPNNRTAVGSASQFFSIGAIPNVMSGWISGSLTLPPLAIKDAEGVGECAQVFFVADCQNGSLEVDYADPKEETWQDETAQRNVVNKGDSFYVPPGNIYRLENHSKDKEVTMFWTIVKPFE